MIFNSANDIYEMLDSDIDLYCVDDGVYMFKYNEAGSIAYYNMSEDELYRLAQDAYAHGSGYIGGELGVGGHIIDVQAIFPNGDLVDYDDPDFDECYEDPKCAIDISDICAFLHRFVGKEIIPANVDDLVEG